MALWPRRMLERLGALGSAPVGDDREALRRATLVLASAFISALACVWVVTYAILGLWVSAAIPFAYQCASAAGLILALRRGRWRLFRTTQLTLMLVLPFLLQWSLGGFAASSFVGLWALVAPLGALLFLRPRPALPWLGAYLGLLGASVALEAAGALPDSDPLPTALGHAFLALNTAAVSVTVLVLLQYFVRARDRAHTLLAAERERSERLLLNVLPPEVAEELKRSPGTIATGHDEVTVLFADLVGFTPLARELPAAHVVGLLNEVFSAFDSLVARHRVEKIKTIGDGYMAAAGVPRPLADHVAAVAELALDMRDMLAALPAARTNGLRLRVGVDTGEVVAGVIGRRKFGYDLWGDTVNIASRMESHAPEGAIQVTDRVHAQLTGRYELSPRGEIEVKGHGRMATYLLLGRADRPCRPAAARHTGTHADPGLGPRA
jgi:adenylate cyclase